MRTLLLCIEHDESVERSREDYCVHPDDFFQPVCCSARTQNSSGLSYSDCDAGAFGGRIDHVLSSLCTLHRHEGEQIILCGDGNLVRLLPKGHSELEPDLAVEGPSCGLVAMGSPAAASSTGLKWDLGVVPTLRLHLRCIQGCNFVALGSKSSCVQTLKCISFKPAHQLFA